MANQTDHLTLPRSNPSIPMGFNLHIRMWMLLLGIALPLVCGAQIRTERIFGKEVPTGDYKHPACFEELANGDLYLVFFSGKGEYRDNEAAVFGSRKKAGGSRWSKPEKIASNPFHSMGNAVVWQAPDGVVWLFFVVRYGELWSHSRIAAKISKDGARTWSDTFMISFLEGSMVRGKPIVLSTGEYQLPVYHEVGEDTESVGPLSTSYFLRFNPTSRKWTESGHIRSSNGNIQPAAVELSPTEQIAFCRRGGNYEPTTNGWLVVSRSSDGGQTWSPGVPSSFPNPNAAVDCIKLKNGHILLVYNDSMNSRTPLTVAISKDQGKTWPIKRNVADGKGDYGYPTALQSRDGSIQILYTCEERTVIRRAVFSESDLEAGRP